MIKSQSGAPWLLTEGFARDGGEPRLWFSLGTRASIICYSVPGHKVSLLPSPLCRLSCCMETMVLQLTSSTVTKETTHQTCVTMTDVSRPVL